MNRMIVYAGYLDIPIEILEFAYKIFLLQEVRGRVGKANGFLFVIHTNEGNHYRPHVHAEYANHSISIALDNNEILAGNVPPGRARDAQKWVANNKCFLLDKWKDIAINRDLLMTKSGLDDIY